MVWFWCVRVGLVEKNGKSLIYRNVMDQTDSVVPVQKLSINSWTSHVMKDTNTKFSDHLTGRLRDICKNKKYRQPWVVPGFEYFQSFAAGRGL